MADRESPWYLRWIVGIGAWVTALVLFALGASFVFFLLDIDSGVALAVFGAVFYALGLWLLRDGGSGVFGEQLGIATAASGGAMIAVGLTGEAESLWVGLVVSLGVAAGVIAVTRDRILQFLAAALVAVYFFAAALDTENRYAADLVALVSAVGLALLLYPPRRDLVPSAVAFLLAYPAFSILAGDIGLQGGWLEQGGAVARVIHILLFLHLVFRHQQHQDNRASLPAIVFAVLAVGVCLLLPPGGSAAMLLLVLAYVIGSRPFAVIGAALQGQFIVRYYYSLEMNLFDKSLLMMAVGLLLVGAWWLLQRHGERSAA